VDAMAVERECGIPEQHHRSRIDRALPWRGLDGLARGLSTAALPAIDEVLRLLERGHVAGGEPVAHGDEDKIAAAALLSLDADDLRDARHGVADAERPEKLEPAARKHPAQQRHRR